MRSRPESFCGRVAALGSCARVTRAPAITPAGAAPSAPNNCLLVSVAIAVSRFLRSMSSRLDEVVAHVLHLPEQHHRVIFVNRVVAVHRVPAPEVAEPHDELDFFVEPEPYHVLPAEFHVAASNQAIVAPDDPELLQMDVNRVLPA